MATMTKTWTLKTSTNRPNWQTLSWWAARKQWRVQYQSKRYTLGPTGVVRNRQSHDFALAIWQRLKSELEGMAEQQTAEEAAALAIVRAAGMVTSRPNQYAELTPTDEQLRERHRGILADAAAKTYGLQPSTPKTSTVGQAAEAFVAFKRAQAESGRITVSRWGELRDKTNNVVAFVGEDKDVSTIHDDNLERYYLYLTKSGTAATAKKQLGAFKQLARWCSYRKLIQPLARLDDKELWVTVEPQQVRPMPMEAWRQRYEAAGDDAKLYLLLMANCGMYQGDISDIKPSEVDWEQGRIIRKRSKRAKSEKAVVVNWKLWPLTFDLLKRQGKRDGERVLLNRNGDPLVRRTIETNNRVKSVDNVRTAIDRLERRKGWSSEQLKAIRKLSSSLLYNSERYNNALSIS